jgi:hypothetical protein
MFVLFAVLVGLIRHSRCHFVIEGKPALLQPFPFGDWFHHSTFWWA